VKVPKNQLPGPIRIEAQFDTGPLRGNLTHSLPLEVVAAPR
jgi:hypothetical protein